MPHNALIAELERLRDAYTQRQKASNNLQSALKGTVAALAKANRAFKDYGEQNAGGGPPALPQSQQFVVGLRLKEEALDPVALDLRRELKALTELAGALKEAAAALRGEMVDVIKLGRAVGVLQGAKIKDPGLSDLLPELERELQQAQRGLGDSFGLSLRHALAEQGIELGGRPPHFEIGPFALEADFIKRSATLSYGKTLVNRRVPLSVEAAFKAYQQAQKAIMGRNEDGQRWIEMLYNAWLIVRRKNETSESRANLVECYIEMALMRQAKAFRSEPSKSGFIDYTRAQFIYDFFTFANTQRLSYRGQRAFGTGATKSQTENPERSFWIVEGASPHAGRYISDLKFDKDE